MGSLPEDNTERSGQAAEEFGSLRKVGAVIVLSVAILTLLLVVISAGTAKWVGDCYSTHVGQRVRWTFPDGCQVEYGTTYLTVGS